MGKARRQFALIVLAVAALSLAVIVLVLNRDAATDILAVGLLVGGLAIVVVSLPPGNGNHDPR